MFFVPALGGGGGGGGGLPVAFTAMGEPTGFPNRTDSTLSKVDGTRTLTLAPAVTSFDYYLAGVKYTISSTLNVVWTDAEGIHYFYLDSDETLKVTTTFTDSLITSDAFVAVLYWDATNNEAIIFGDERHGIAMDGYTHSYLHNVFGARYVSGLALSGMTVDGNGSDDTHAQFAVGSGEIVDEDLSHTIDDTIQDITPTAQIPILYQLGATGTWRRKTPDDFPVIYSGSAGYTGANDRLAYNLNSGGTWSLAEIGSSEYVLVHLFATNDISWPIIGIQGQSKYTSIVSARNGARTELNQMILSGLPFLEFVPIATILFQSNAGYSNSVNARIVSTDSGDDYVDWRGVDTPPGSGVSLYAHDLAGELHNADTIANLNSKVSDATLEVQGNKDAANGYAGLDGSTKLSGSQQTYGSSANTACEGNDSRLSDSRTPTAHDFAGALHNADTWTDFTSKISDQTPVAINIAQAFTAAQRASPQSLTVSGGAVAVDASARNVFYFTLSDATQELSNPSNATDGMVLWFFVKSGSAGRILTYGTQYDWGDDGSDDLSGLATNAWAILMATRIPGTTIWAMSAQTGFGP